MQYDVRNVQVTRRSFLRGVGLLSASAALAACSPAAPSAGSTTSPDALTAAATPLLAIIHTNDTHGHDVAVEGTQDVAGNFSMAAVPALKADWEKKGYDVIVLDAGDATQGMPLVDTNKGASAIAFMNACGYDAMAVGNHEFDWGIDKFEENRKAARFPFLSANTVDKATGEAVIDAHATFELSDGTKLGVFGLTTPETVASTSPKNVASLTFLSGEDLYACAQEQVDQLRGEGCDLVVCLAHLGNDSNSGSNSRDVLGHVSGIDLLIDGHDHEEVQDEVAGTPLVESGCYLHNIGVVVIDEGAPSTELVAAGTYDGIDGSAQAILDEENDRTNKEQAVVLGATPFLLDGNRDPGVRTQETNLGDFCADAYRWMATQELGQEVDAAVLNGGSLRTSIEAGDITLGAIKTVLPFANELAVIKVTGAQLLEAFEASYQSVGEKALGGFSQVSNITLTIDASVPFEEGPTYPDSTYATPANPGARVTIHEIGGQAFDVNRTYTIAATSFMCQGGDTYYAFREAYEAETPVIIGFDYEALSSYLMVGCDHEVPAEYAEPQGRITITGLA